MRLVVGRVGRPHGLDGAVSVVLTTDRTERLDPGSELYVGDRRLVVSRSHFDGKRWRVHFEGVDDRNAADELVTRELEADALEDDDTLWVHELIGATVIDEAGADRGTVVSIVANPASDLMELSSGALVPLRFVVDGPTDGVVRVDVPEGLWDL